MFKREQCETIHRASLEILRRTGVRILHDRALSLLRETDAVVTDHNLVRFGQALQPCRKIDRLTRRGSTLQWLVAEQVADDDKSTRDPDAHCKRRAGRRLDVLDRSDDLEPRAHSLADYIATIGRLKELDIDLVLTGHGETMPSCTDADMSSMS